MKIGKLVTYGEVNAPIKSQIKYFFCQRTYGHKFLQSADTWWGKAYNEVARIWSRDHKRSGVKSKT